MTTYATDDQAAHPGRALADKFKRAGRPVLPEDPPGALRALGVTPWADVPDFSGEDKIVSIARLVLAGPDDPEVRRFTVVESGNGVGKSVTAAAVACAWMARGRPAAIVTLAPTHSQVNHVLWRYMRQMHREVPALPGTVYETPRWDAAPDWYGVGLSPRRASQEDLQALYGYHNPRLLVILDEAPGLPRLLWEAVQRLVTAPGNKVLALGNPLEQAGPFWEACNSPDWNHVHVSCLDHPNVVLGRDAVPGATGREWVEERIRDHCLRAAPGDPGAFEWPAGSGRWHQPDGVFQSMVLGRAPTEATDQLISLAWVDSAASWTAEPDPAEPVVLALDPSRASHGDAAALVARRGALVLYVKRRRCSSGDPTGELAGWLLAEYHAVRASRVFVEETGLGAGIVDRARSLGLPVVPVSPGSGASRRNMANKRAECWWRLREQLQGGALSIPQDDMLMADLTTPKFHFDGQGRVLLESKEKIRDRLGRSPDSGDALALSFALPTRARPASLETADLKADSRWASVAVGEETAAPADPAARPAREVLTAPNRWHFGRQKKRRFRR